MLETTTSRSIGKRSKSTAAQLTTTATNSNSSHSFPDSDSGNGSTLSSTALDEPTVVRLLLDSNRASLRRRQPVRLAAIQVRRQRWHIGTETVPDSVDWQHKRQHQQRFLQPPVGVGGRADKVVSNRASRASVTFASSARPLDTTSEVQRSVGSVERDVGCLRGRLHQRRDNVRATDEKITTRLVRFSTLARITIHILRLCQSTFFSNNKLYDKISPYYNSLLFAIEAQCVATEDLLFDRTRFKANRRLPVAEEAKKILLKQSWQRTDKDLAFLLRALHDVSSFAELPIRMQRKLAEVGRYECYETKRLIVMQDDPARSFYIILSGSVVVLVTEEDSSITRPVATLRRGMAFGELAMINRTRRQSTIIVKENVELMSIDIDEYHKIFMLGGNKNINDPDHLQFVTSTGSKLDLVSYRQHVGERLYFGSMSQEKRKSLKFLDGWPIEKILEPTPKCIFHYFRRGEILVRNSQLSSWIIIVKSGTLNVLKKLKRVVTADVKAHHRRLAIKHKLPVLLGGCKSKSKSWTAGGRTEDYQLTATMTNNGNIYRQTLQQQQQGASVSGNAVQQLTAVCQLMSRKQAYTDAGSYSQSLQQQPSAAAAALLAAGNVALQSKGSKAVKAARFHNSTATTMTSSRDEHLINVTDISLRYNKPSEAGFGRYRRKSLVGRLVTELGGRGQEFPARCPEQPNGLDDSSQAIIPPSQPTKRRRAAILHPPLLFEFPQLQRRRRRRHKRRTCRIEGDPNDDIEKNDDDEEWQSRTTREGRHVIRGDNDTDGDMESCLRDHSKWNSDLNDTSHQFDEENIDFEDDDDYDSEAGSDGTDTDDFQKHQFNQSNTEHQQQAGIRTIAADIDTYKNHFTSSEDPSEADTNPQFVIVQVLSRGQVFGLSDVLLGSQPSLSVISNGAECILLDKQFYIENAPEVLLRRMRLQECCPYPTDDEMQQKLMASFQWNKFRQNTIHEVVTQLNTARLDRQI